MPTITDSRVGFTRAILVCVFVLIATVVPAANETVGCYKCAPALGHPEWSDCIDQSENTTAYTGWTGCDSLDYGVCLLWGAYCYYSPGGGGGGINT